MAGTSSSANENKLLVALRGVELCFDGHGDVLRKVDFEIRAGEFTAIVGPSGCGKTSILRLLAGLQEPTSGAVHVEGNPTIACVFQEPNLLPWRTVSGNIRLPLEFMTRTPGGQAQAVSDVIRLIGLRASDQRKFPRMLSGGMRMRVSLARALVTDPELLLLDEPFAALDDILRQQLNEELLRIWSEQRWGSLFVTHNVSEAVFLSQRVALMSAHPGRIMHVVDVPFPYPRLPSLRGDAAFARLTAHVGQLLRDLAG